jgi:hypothetical protein
MSDNFLGGFKTLPSGEQFVANYVWDTNTLTWVPQTFSTGGIGPAADVNVTNASLAVTQAGTWNVTTTDTHTTASAPISVRLTDGSNFYAAGQGNISTAAKGTTAAGGPTSENTDANTQALHVKMVNASVPVTGTFYPATQPVSIAATVNTTDTHTTAIAPLAVRLTDGSSFYSSNGMTSLVTSAKGGTATGNPTSENTDANTQSLHVRVTNTAIPVTGSFWQATQPVSLASLPALGAGTNTIGSIKLTDGTSTATIGNLTNNKALATMIVDGTGNQITSFGGGSQYSDGATQATPTGTVIMGKRASNVLNALSLDTSGNLNVNLAAGTISGGNAAASATGSVVPASADYMGFNSSGNLVGVSAANPLPVTMATAPTTPVTGTFWQATQPVSIATAPVLVAGSAIIGKVGVDQTTPGTTNAVSLSHVGNTVVVTGGVSGSIGVGGITAAGSASSGNPVRVGARAATTNPTAVSDGQVSNIMTDKMGRQVVVQGHTRELVGKQATTITSSTTATTVVTAGGASVFTDLTSLTVTNSSATATLVTLSDGTVSMVFNVPGGGGFTMPFNPPMPATTANTAWTLTCGTSVASIYCNVVYAKNL